MYLVARDRKQNWRPTPPATSVIETVKPTVSM